MQSWFLWLLLEFIRTMNTVERAVKFKTICILLRSIEWFSLKKLNSSKKIFICVQALLYNLNLQIIETN